MGRRVVVILVFGIVGAACGGSVGSQAAHPPTTTTTTTTTVVSTPTATGPCGGSLFVPVAVRASPVAGLNLNPTQYRVENVSLARSDPNWARFDTLPAAGQESVYQGGSGLAHCGANIWSVTDFGTTEVGCPGGAVAAPPEAVRADLGIQCP